MYILYTTERQHNSNISYVNIYFLIQQILCNISECKALHDMSKLSQRNRCIEHSIKYQYNKNIAIKYESNFQMSEM